MRWLSTSEGQTVLPYVGAQGEPPEMTNDRENVAAPFYVFAQSFVKFLAERVGDSAVQALADSQDFEEDASRLAGQGMKKLKDEWLASLGVNSRKK